MAATLTNLFHRGDATLISAYCEQLFAAHVRDFHGPANAVESDTAADVKEGGRWYRDSEGYGILWRYDDAGGKVFTQSASGIPAVDDEHRHNHKPMTEREAEELLARIRGTPAPSPTPAQAPERVWVHFYNDGSCIASAKRVCFYDNSTDEPCYIHLDLADARVADKQRIIDLATAEAKRLEELNAANANEILRLRGEIQAYRHGMENILEHRKGKELPKEERHHPGHAGPLVD